MNSHATGTDQSYIVILSPDASEFLRGYSARAEYKRRSHDERYKRRYGHFPIPVDAEIGQIEGMIFNKKGGT